MLLIIYINVHFTSLIKIINSDMTWLVYKGLFKPGLRTVYKVRIPATYIEMMY